MLCLVPTAGRWWCSDWIPFCSTLGTKRLLTLLLKPCPWSPTRIAKAIFLWFQTWFHSYGTDERYGNSVYFYGFVFALSALPFSLFFLPLHCEYILYAIDTGWGKSRSAVVSKPEFIVVLLFSIRTSRNLTLPPLCILTRLPCLCHYGKWSLLMIPHFYGITSQPI